MGDPQNGWFGCTPFLETSIFQNFLTQGICFYTVYISGLDHKLLTTPMLYFWSHWTYVGVSRNTESHNSQKNHSHNFPFERPSIEEHTPIFRLTHICSFAGILVDRNYVNVSWCVSFSQTNASFCLTYFPGFDCWWKHVYHISRCDR